MKVLYYCQHVLGVGHFFRSLEIARALEGHEVVMVSGGQEVDAPLPDHVRLQRLPGLMMNEDFSEMFPSDPDADLDEVKRARTEELLSLLEAMRPDILLVELFPFGRNGFRFELLPALKGIAEGRFGPVKVVCSLRDILVEKAEREKYEDRVVSRLNRYFHGLCVHADPRLQPLDETFTRVADIRVPLAYTGFVAPRPTPGVEATLRSELGLEPGEKLIVASAGGGKVGTELLLATVEACRLLPPRTFRLLCFTGPFVDPGPRDRLRALSADRPEIEVETFSDRFLDLLASADLSISMAGYNTAMNILASGVKALVWPFAQNREQRMRADKLYRLEALEILEDEDLEPRAFMRRINEALRGRPPQLRDPIDMDGARSTARFLERLARG